MMKAAVVEKPNSLVVREIPMPEVGEYDALCQLLYGATCSGTDRHIIAGTFPFGVNYPTILGHESIGRVVKVGPKVRNYKLGDLVTRVGCPPLAGLNINWGGFAEYGLARDHRAMKEAGLPLDQWTGYRVNQIIPSDFNPAGATLIITWRETLSYLTRLGVTPGDKVLIIGSGGNGLSFTAHAKNLGAACVALVGSPSCRDRARSVGADAFFDYHDPEIKQSIQKACPDGFHVIIDAVGKSGQIDRVLPCLKPGGKIGIYGVDDYFKYTITPTLAPGTFTFSNNDYDEEETHTQVVRLIREKKLRAEDFCDLKNVFTLDEINQAFDAVKNRQMVKAIVKLS
jgi:L-iditol 2-dehydrogenase